jgi:ureidoacrylate peracid hydrolase
MCRLEGARRAAGVEVTHTLIEHLTVDGRDAASTTKISGIDVAKGSWDAKACAAIAPGDDEIVLTKTSSSVFISANVDYVLRKLGVRQLVLCGVVADQRAESAVRDAFDLGTLSRWFQTPAPP